MFFMTKKYYIADPKFSSRRRKKFSRYARCKAIRTLNFRVEDEKNLAGTQDAKITELYQKINRDYFGQLAFGAIS